MGKALADGILATFDVQGERFTAWITKSNAIQQVLDLKAGKSKASIPSSIILKGPGESDFNAPWNWHMSPEDIGMTEFSIELCDGKPSDVQGNLNYWLNTVKRFCPWRAMLVDVRDLRKG